MLAKLFLYLSAVGNHWLFSFGGVVLVVIAVIETVRKRKLAERIFWVLAAICLFIAFYQAWLDEHRNTEVVIGEKAALWSKFNQCDIERASKSVLADGYYSQIREERNRIDSQQNTIDTQLGTVTSCVAMLTKQSIPQPFTVKIKENLLSTIKQTVDGKEYMFWIIQVFVNKTLTPVRGTFSCDNPFSLVGGGMEVAGESSIMAVNQGPINDREVKVGIMSPAVNPDSPLMVFIMAPNPGPGTCNFRTN